VFLRADSAFYNASVVNAALTAIADDAWSTIEYTDATFDQDSQRWISRADRPNSHARNPASQHKDQLHQRGDQLRVGRWI